MRVIRIVEPARVEFPTFPNFLMSVEWLEMVLSEAQRDPQRIARARMSAVELREDNTAFPLFTQLDEAGLQQPL